MSRYQERVETMKRWIVGFAALVMLAGAGQVWASVAIGPGAFGGGAVVESFEGLSPGPNMTLAWTGYGYLEPGVVGPYTFASGASFTGPVPNPGVSTGVIIGDFSIGPASFGLGLINGTIGSASDVPFGSAYMGLDNPAYAGPVEFTFATDMLRVGAYVSGMPGTVTMEAFDAVGTSLGTHSVATVDLTLWPSNFLGLEDAAGIRRVTFSGDYEVLDGLTSETDTVIPEPCTFVIWSLLGALGITVGWYRRRKAA